MKEKWNINWLAIQEHGSIQKYQEHYLKENKAKVMFLDSSGKVISDQWEENTEYWIVDNTVQVGDVVK